jgi:hypothetical protein
LKIHNQVDEHGSNETSQFMMEIMDNINTNPYSELMDGNSGEESNTNWGKLREFMQGKGR